MSADKHRGKGLEIDAAYLSLAAREWGLPVNRSHSHILTDRLKALAGSGLVEMVRQGTLRSRTSTYRITPAGVARLADLRRRNGDDFGRHELIGETEYRRRDQSVRRADRWESARRLASSRREHRLRMEQLKLQG